jgi:hypothetical protein
MIVDDIRNDGKNQFNMTGSGSQPEKVRALPSSVIVKSQAGTAHAIPCASLQTACDFLTVRGSCIDTGIINIILLKT